MRADGLPTDERAVNRNLAKAKECVRSGPHSLALYMVWGLMAHRMRPNCSTGSQRRTSHGRDGLYCGVPTGRQSNATFQSVPIIVFSRSPALPDSLRIQWNRRMPIQHLAPIAPTARSAMAAHCGMRIATRSDCELANQNGERSERRTKAGAEGQGEEARAGAADHRVRRTAAVPLPRAVQEHGFGIHTLDRGTGRTEA